MSSFSAPARDQRPRRGLFLAPFDELSDPLVLVDLAVRAEAAGWVAARWPVRRALHWDGLFPIELPGPEALAELAAEIAGSRSPERGPFDLVVEIEPGGDPGPWVRAGATWVLTGFGRRPRADEVRAAIAAGAA